MVLGASSFLLLAVHCTYFQEPASALHHAEQLFLHGYLEASQEEAARGYARVKQTDPELASRFALLNAEDMIWRGMFVEAQQVLSAESLEASDPALKIRKLSLEVVASSRLRQFPVARERLAEVEKLCAASPLPTCGEAIRAHGVLAVQEGQYKKARSLYLETLAFARIHRDRALEATAYLNLGFVALLEDRYDEAADWSRLAYQAGLDLGDENQIQGALGNLGTAYRHLGDADGAADNFTEAESRATRLGNIRDQLGWRLEIGNLYMAAGNLRQAKESYNGAMRLAQQIDSKSDVEYAFLNLALVAVATGDSAEAEANADQAYRMAQQSGSRPDELDAIGIQMQASALRGDVGRATKLLEVVEADPETYIAMKWECKDAMGRLYEAKQQTSLAESAYRSALNIFNSARAELEHAESQLPFVANATPIYDDYIHFLVTQGRTEDALLVADQSRARTLAQGLGSSAHEQQQKAFSPQMVARKAGATLLFYWLGEKQSYLWAVTSKKTTLFPLPAQAKISSLVERYNKELLGSGDPIQTDGGAGQELYAMLVAPAAQVIQTEGASAGKAAPVMVLTDGSLSLLNFETLIAPANKLAGKSQSNAPARPHYWIEDATVISAPSLAMLAAAKYPDRDRHAGGKLLLLGDAVSPEPDYPELPFASLEMKEIEKHFAAGDESIFARSAATSEAYLRSEPRKYSYIHFVSHGVASRTDPLDSAIILSRAKSKLAEAGQGAFKLYAREIMQHPIDARVVTISACYSSGTRAFAGEGLVGLSWAFLRAGAHSTIGALWEVNDNSTARLMGSFYQGLEAGLTPALALRNAKLGLLHSEGNFRKPFYWAPFQLYTRM